MNKKITTELAVGVILILAILVGTIFWMQNKKQDVANNLQQPVAQKGKQQQQAQPADQAVAWQTYTNDKFGFEFQYPKDLSAEQNTNVDYFSLDIGEKSDDNATLSSDQPLNLNYSVKKTGYKNTNEWFNAWKKEFEKPSDYEGTIIHPKVGSVVDSNINGIEIKKYVPGGGVFPFSNICAGFVKNGFEYNICYGGGVKISDYASAKIGVDEYGQNKYDEKKLEDAKVRYAKLFNDILATLKFTK